MLFLEFAHATIDLLNPDRVGVPHRSATEIRESIAVHEHRIDIARAQRVTFPENSRTYIYQGVNAALDDLFRRNVPLWNSGFCAPHPQPFGNFRIGTCEPLRVIPVPANAGFLPESAQFAETVFHIQPPCSRPILVFDSPSNSPHDI